HRAWLSVGTPERATQTKEKKHDQEIRNQDAGNDRLAYPRREGRRQSLLDPHRCSLAAPERRWPHRAARPCAARRQDRPSALEGRRHGGRRCRMTRTFTRHYEHHEIVW